MTPAQQMEIVEVEIDDAKVQISMADSLMRLHKNKDFKKVFLEGYMKDDLVRAVKSKADPACQDAVSQSMLNQRIESVGQLDQFMRTVFIFGNMASKSLADYEAVREEMLSEEE